MQTQAELVVELFFRIVYWLVIVRVILSWIPHNPNHPVFQMLYDGTDLILAPIRRIMPKSSLPIDFSPFISLILLGVIQQAIINFIRSM